MPIQLGRGGIAIDGYASRASRGAYMENWYVYDYDGGSGLNVNVFYPVEDNGEYVTADDSKWRVDTPEDPDSVLAFIRYQRWVESGGTVVTSNGDPIDLTGATVRFELRGDGLDLKGGHCTFWVLSYDRSQRWHNTVTLPSVVNGSWSSYTLLIENDPGDWHMSWEGSPQTDDLGLVLANVHSYGIAFVGFSSEPTGAIDMRGFTFTLP